MSQPSGFLILYVDNVARSVAFYERALERPALEASEGFAMFALEGGWMLGLWARAGVVPPAGAAAGGSELALVRARPQEVDACHARWAGLGIEILQAPADLDFGHAFTAQDPDGHRLRVVSPAAA